jgi:NAD(P)-dependent dehydrogenase (short-subunit alcohol dehydrogenase family)
VQSLSGKVVLITGASAGIGKALAYGYARRRASVVITGRRLDRLEHLAAELTADGYSALPLLCDVRKDGDIEQAVGAALARYGKLKIVVANAGFGVVGAFAELSLDDYRAQFETNVFGVIRTTYAAVPELRKTQGSLAAGQHYMLSDDAVVLNFGDQIAKDLSSCLLCFPSIEHKAAHICQTGAEQGPNKKLAPISNVRTIQVSLPFSAGCPSFKS